MSYPDGTWNWGAFGALFGSSTPAKPPTQKPMPQNLYEVAIIQRPTAEQREMGKLDDLILPPIQVMAESERVAIALAVQKAMAEKTLMQPILPTAEVQFRKFQ